LCHAGVTWSQDDGLLPRAVDFQGNARSYYVGLPHDFDPDQTYWPLVVVHGGGGHARANPKAAALRRFAHEADLPAILIQPEFVAVDKQVSRFPILGEDEFLKAVLMKVGAEYKLHPRMLLTGYSMGGQFSHRFALANPELVQACAAFAAGTWTTPDGRLLIEGYGEVSRPEAFLSTREYASRIPERLHDLFDERTAKVAGLPAADGADRVPFLVMCGTVDTRFGIAVKFANSLREAGFIVETEWPRTPHGANSAQYASEFEKFPRHAIRFFQTHTASVR
jgi:pimeloyl-ACP methyl ester carboxylesterase